MNKNIVATISQSKYKDVLLNKKCLRYWKNRIQKQNHKIATYAYFDDKLYIQNNGCNGLSLDSQS